MTEHELLIDRIEQAGIYFMHTENARCPAHTLRTGRECAIFFDEKGFETDAERVVALAHEKGHCDTGAFYNEKMPMCTKERCERRAWKRTVLDMVPLERLKKAFKVCGSAEGVAVWDVAEYLGVTEEFVGKAVEVYRRMGLLAF